MSRPNLILTLAKVIIAAAWADGEIDNHEINNLKDLLFHLPNITGREWGTLEMYIEAPVGPGERARLVDQLQSQLRTSKDQRFALEALTAMIEADGQITESERTVFAEIKTAIESADVGLFGQLTKLVRGPVTRRTDQLETVPNREKFFEDFVKNKVFYEIRRRMELEGTPLDIPEADLRKLSLAGGLMAQIALVDQTITEDEKKRISTALEERWNITVEKARFVTEVAVSEVTKELDYYRLTRGFFDSTTEDERLGFLDVLFSIADADGYVSHQEIEEIRTIANSLKLTHQQFISAKLKIPGDRRAN